MNKSIKIDKKEIEDIIALTPMQEGMLFHHLKNPGADCYFEQLSLNITGEIDTRCFEQAWNFVIRTNRMLRTVFRWEAVDKPVQIIFIGVDVVTGTPEPPPDMDSAAHGNGFKQGG